MKTFRIGDIDINEGELAAMFNMVNSEGWKVFERILKANKMTLADEAMDPDTEVEEWHMGQGGVRVLNFLLDIPADVVQEFDSNKDS